MSSWLTDDIVGHLRQVASWPDLSDTKYVVMDEIGRGGMGTVYRAADTQLGRDVAIKVINAAGDHAALAARLALEARVLARLDHPGVVPIHECGTLADGRAFYVMKLVRGDVLEAWLARQEAEADAGSHWTGGAPADRAARIDERLRLFERIAEPVAFAHAHGIVHRDLKPQNVMLGPFGEVLVMDWGAAWLPRSTEPAPAEWQARADDVPLPRPPGASTWEGAVIGTPGYMPPEQARGMTAAVDARADVYALGALLLHLLAGGPPPADAAAAATAIARAPVLPKQLRAVLAKALAADPAGRYAHAGAFAADIARVRAREPVEAYPERWLDRAARFYATYHMAILLVLAYLTMRTLVALFWHR